LALYIIFQKKISALWLLIKDNFIAVALVLASYLPVILFNDSLKLFNPNGGNTRFQSGQENAVDLILSHLKSVCAYLFYREQLLPAISFLVPICVVLYLYKKGKSYSFVPVLSVIMFFSPLVILLLHKVIPFERTWLFLIFPAAICFGCGAQSISDLLPQKIPALSALKKPCLYAFFLAIMLFSLARFPSKHEHFARMDFAAENLRKKYINAVAGSIREIAFTKKQDEYYSADLIWNYCLKDNPERNIKIGKLAEIRDQDLLIIHRSELNNFKDKLGAYKLLLDFDESIFIYGKSALF
jgi:hypothetical protein